MALYLILPIFSDGITNLLTGTGWQIKLAKGLPINYGATIFFGLNCTTVYGYRLMLN
uniref:Uncharacterized protein n=1 Tax=Rhizophora mucronata TaxID=61149 RepID=A0A2P2Q9A9_RHIMU